MRLCDVKMARYILYCDYYNNNNYYYYLHDRWRLRCGDGDLKSHCLVSLYPLRTYLLTFWCPDILLVMSL